MTDTVKRARVNPTARAIRWVLVVQVAIAVLLFGRDIAATLPHLGFAPDAPELDDPVAPGDQTRRYDPTRLPFRPAAPGTDAPPTVDMPSRLQFAGVPGQDGLLRISGVIETGDADRFADWLSTTSLAFDRVALHSPGGSVTDALEIGRVLRGMDVATLVQPSEICLSACPYLLAAGTVRSVGEGAYVGVHQHYFDENTVLPAFLAVEDIQRGQGLVLEYLIEMDIDPRLMRHALVTPPERIYILTPEELLDYRMVTPPEAAGQS